MGALKSYIKKNKGVLSENQNSIESGLKYEVDDELPEGVDIRKALNSVSKMLPRELLRQIQLIKVGEHDKLESRGVDAILTNDDILLVTNDQNSNRDFVEDIIHEIGHIAEEEYASEIYSDASIKREFLKKRRVLYQRLKAHGYKDINKDKFEDLKYDEGFDKFLWKDVGYDVVAQLTHDILHDPYAATSLREYWSCAFEEYYLSNPNIVRDYYPNVYQKIKEIV